MGTKKLVKAGEPQQTAPQTDLSDQLILFERWLVNNWRKVTVVAGILVAAIILWGIIVTVNQSIENNAEEALSGAKDIAELEALMPEYGDTDAANFYRITIAADAAGKGDAAKALALYLEVADSAPDSALKASALMAAAALQEKTGAVADAAATYASLAADTAYTPAVQTEAAYHAGRLSLLLENPAAAREHLEAAMNIGTPSGNLYADMAKQLLRKINN